MFEVFSEQHRWNDILGVNTVGGLNEACAKGFTTELINVSEALQEKRIAAIADHIASMNDVKLILIAGPSSSGKTTFCKRLSVQLMACGLKPLSLSTDDYFVDRDKTPLDEEGKYDFEHIDATNIPLLTEHINALIRGEEVETQRYDFVSGKAKRVDACSTWRPTISWCSRAFTRSTRNSPKGWTIGISTRSMLLP